MIVLGWAALPSPARAHEFRLALITPTSAAANAELSGSDVRDGFRLAVDQSPDVSHPAGADAGDHLGGIDVDVSVIDSTDPAHAAASLKQQLATGLTAAVVIASAPTARAVTAELADSGVLVMTAGGAGASAPSNASALHVRQRSATQNDSAVAAAAAAAFGRAYQRELTPAGALGYDAGRLLDAAIARAEDGVEDLDAVVAAAPAVTDVLISSELAVPRTAASVGNAPRDQTLAPGSALMWLMLFGGAVAGVSAGIFLWRARLSRRAPTEFTPQRGSP